MRPDDTAALEATAWADFVQRLGDHLAGQWPAMPERLGDRYPAFITMAVQQALEQGLTQAASVARYVNLWFVWGPAYHGKPGFEWAQALLAAGRDSAQAAAALAPKAASQTWRSASAPPPGQDWLTVHQLVQRSLAELARLPGSRIEPQALAAADARVIEAFGKLGRQGRMRPQASADPLPTPRAACDLEAADIRVLDEPTLLRYTLGSGTAAGTWQREPLALPPALRVDAKQPMPALLAVLSHAPDDGAQAQLQTPPQAQPLARLQVRSRALVLCNGDIHPVLGFSGPHGRWIWAGHEAKAASWPVAARAQPLPGAGPGSALAEETSPELQRLEIECCGLRDDGHPLGGQQALVSVWPAAQWWMELQRGVPAPAAVLPGPRAWVRGSTRCRVERDGAVQDSTALRQQFEDGLDAALAVGLQALAAAWDATPGLTHPSLDAQIGLLTGQASLTWGWHYGPAGLGGPALMRVVGDLALAAVQADLQLGGELSVAGTRSRITLRVAGLAELRQTVRREAPAPPLAEVLLGVVARWRFPVDVALAPMVVASAGLLQVDGPVTGALVGEAGLRPSTQGHSGWEWFVGLRLEPVAVPLHLSDPLLGQQRVQQALLPAMTLVHWSLG